MFLVAPLAAFDIVRRSMFISSYAIFILYSSFWQIKNVTEKLKKTVFTKYFKLSQLRYNLMIIKYAYVMVLLENIKFDRKLMNKFFIKSAGINIMSNVVIIGSLLIGIPSFIMKNILIIIAILQFVIISLVASALIISSEQLLKVSNPLYSAIILLNKYKRSNIKNNFRLSLFYELTQNKKPFRYNFGPLGRISQKSLISFWLFYFSMLFMIIEK